MWSLVPLLLIPLLVALGFKLFHPNKRGFTAHEFLALEAGMSVLLLAGFLLARWGAIQDTEFWNGRITAKPSGTESCCHCYTVCTARNSKGHCTAHRRVCPHGRDHWWALDFSTGDRITIESCQPSSLMVPRAWDIANVGDPAAIPHGYTNYLLADPDSVLRQHADPEKVKTVPEYPVSFGFYRANRAINQGTSMDADAWNQALMELNADLGSTKQANVVVVATREQDPAYADVVETAWLYGKKNDVVFVLGAPDGKRVQWVRVVTISHAEMLKINARDTLSGYGYLLDEPGPLLTAIRTLVEHHYQRTSMKEFEYLGAAAKPKWWALILLYALGVAGAVFGSVYMIQNDVFGHEAWYRKRGRMGF